MSGAQRRPTIEAIARPARLATLAPPAEREKLRSLLGEVVEPSRVGEIPMDVWVDEFDLVRKLTIAFSATQPGTTEQATASMSS